MAMTKFEATWVDTTEQTVVAAPCRVTAIEVMMNVAQTAAFLQFWDATGPTPGTTDTFLCIPIPVIAVQGLMRKFKVIFPGGGLRFATACTMFIGVGPESATAVTTTAIPEFVKVFYTIGN